MKKSKAELNGHCDLELHLKYRPTTFDEVIGQPQAVKVLSDFVAKKRVPHAILLSGDSGCGKTTLARILKDQLGCSDLDFQEVNCGMVEALETSRSIDVRMRQHPLDGPCKVWILDELQSWSRSQHAQQSLLKVLEDTPRHAYFMLATTAPDKIIKAIRGRCTTVQIVPLKRNSLTKLVSEVAEKEGAEVSDEVIEKIAECAEGSARNALVLLNQVIGLEDDEERLKCITAGGAEKDAFELVKALLWEKSSWSKVAEIIKRIGDQDWERLRYLILANATNECLKAGKNAAKAFTILTAFEENWYDSKRAGLVRACYEVVSGG